MTVPCIVIKYKPITEALSVRPCMSLQMGTTLSFKKQLFFQLKIKKNENNNKNLFSIQQRTVLRKTFDLSWKFKQKHNHNITIGILLMSMDWWTHLLVFIRNIRTYVIRQCSARIFGIFRIFCKKYIVHCFLYYKEKK